MTRSTAALALAHPGRSPFADADAPAFAAARDICRRYARSFYFASHFLPKPKRQAAYAVYAFCRMMDDAVDGDEAAAGDGSFPRSVVVTPTAGCPTGTCGPSSSLELRLGHFRDRLDEVYAGALTLPPLAGRTEGQHALHAFAVTVRRYDIPKQHFLDLAEGCRMDLTVSRYATWAALERYCYHVAGVVGLVMARVFELSDERAARHAVTMGNAMQLTNILRDVKEDWDRGRVYLPQEDLFAFRYSEADLAKGVVNDAFRNLMRFQIDRARRMYTEAAEGLCHLGGDGSRLTACAMAVIYSGILPAIERQGYDVFARRARLTARQKLLRLPAAWRLGRRKPNEPVPAVFG